MRRMKKKTQNKMNRRTKKNKTTTSGEDGSGNRSIYGSLHGYLGVPKIEPKLEPKFEPMRCLQSGPFQYLLNGAIRTHVVP